MYIKNKISSHFSFINNNWYLVFDQQKLCILLFLSKYVHFLLYLLPTLVIF
jgi:hypothetical protein